VNFGMKENALCSFRFVFDSLTISLRLNLVIRQNHLNVSGYNVISVTFCSMHFLDVNEIDVH